MSEKFHNLKTEQIKLVKMYYIQCRDYFQIVIKIGNWHNTCGVAMLDLILLASPSIERSGYAFSVPSKARLFCPHIFNKMAFDIFLAAGETNS